MGSVWNTCKTCHGHRFVAADPPPDACKPCPMCCRDTHDRWARGAYGPTTRIEAATGSASDDTPTHIATIREQLTGRKTAA